MVYWSRRSVVRTPPCHGDYGGSIPLGTAICLRTHRVKRVDCQSIEDGSSPFGGAKANADRITLPYNKKSYQLFVAYMDR